MFQLYIVLSRELTVTVFHADFNCVFFGYLYQLIKSWFSVSLKGQFTHFMCENEKKLYNREKNVW